MLAALRPLDGRRAGRAAACRKGLAACGLGLLLGSIGAAPATGEFRMVWDVDYLYDGIPLVIVGLGLFAVPGDRRPAAQRTARSPRATGLGPAGCQGVRDMVDHFLARSAVPALGCMIGAIPGLGGVGRRLDRLRPRRADRRRTTRSSARATSAASSRPNRPTTPAGRGADADAAVRHPGLRLDGGLPRRHGAARHPARPDHGRRPT